MVGQIAGEFAATELDGFGVEAGDARQLADGWSVRGIGQGADIPAALGFRHATEQQVDLVMASGELAVGVSCAGMARATMHHWLRLCSHSVPP
jgi:hypothetical protein